MATTYSLTVTPQTIDSGASASLSLDNTGSTYASISNGGQVSRVRPGRSYARAVGGVVTAWIDPPDGSTGSISVEVSGARGVKDSATGTTVVDGTLGYADLSQAAIDALVAAGSSTYATSKKTGATNHQGDTSPVAGFTFPVRTLDLATIINHTEDPTVLIKTALRRGFSFVWVSELIAAMEGRGTLPQKPILLTYDDGRTELNSVARSVIASYGIKANAFLASNFLTPSGGSIDSSISGFTAATWAQVQAMHATGLWEWHNHTASHQNLEGLSIAQQQAEIGACNAAILSYLGVTPQALAYPNGVYDGNTFTAARSQGMKAGFDYNAGKSMGSRRPSKIATHPFVLNRSANPGGAGPFLVLDDIIDTVLLTWAWDCIGERNDANALGFWTLPARGTITELGQSITIDNTVTQSVQSVITADYLPTKISPVYYTRFYLKSVSQSAGTGIVRLVQYDAAKTLIAYSTLATVTAAQGFASYEAETAMDPACRFVRFEMVTDATYNGQLVVKNHHVEEVR